MLRTHLASLVIGTVVLGGAGSAVAVTGVRSHTKAEASVDAQVQSHVDQARDAFAKASALARTGAEGAATAETLVQEGTGQLLEAVDAATETAGSGSTTATATMRLTARTSADLAAQLASGAMAQTGSLLEAKNRLAAAIDQQQAAARALVSDQSTQVLSILQSARAGLDATVRTATTTPAPPPAVPASASAEASASLNVAGAVRLP